MSKWIKTEDKKPESGKPVIACWVGASAYDYDGQMEICYWLDGWERASVFDGGETILDPPTHWMELPDAPTGFAPGWTPADGVEECHG